jgi:prepilin-type N-terminal cleavage/methylation domain-containing protein
MRRRRDGPAASRAGFTLLELMVVVAIIAVLASVALPNLRRYVYRARRTEAILALTGVYQAQLSYLHDKGRYGDTFDEIGFELLGGQRIDERTLQGRFYTYTIQALSQGGRAGANFQVVATGDIDPQDPILDILMIENDLTIVE